MGSSLKTSLSGSREVLAPNMSLHGFSPHVTLATWSVLKASSQNVRFCLYMYLHVFTFQSELGDSNNI